MSDPDSGAISIRDCRLEDVEAVLQLWRQADATPGVTDTAEDLQRAIFKSPAHVLVAEAGGRLVGSIIGTFDGWRGNIYRLAVHPDYRRKGIARALVAEIECRLARQGAKRITALVEKDHAWVVGFWEAVDFKADDRIVRPCRGRSRWWRSPAFGRSLPRGQPSGCRRTTCECRRQSAGESRTLPPGLRCPCCRCERWQMRLREWQVWRSCGVVLLHGGVSCGSGWWERIPPVGWSVKKFIIMGQQGAERLELLLPVPR